MVGRSNGSNRRHRCNWPGPNVAALRRWSSWLRDHGDRQHRHALRAVVAGELRVCAVGAVDLCEPATRHLFAVHDDARFLRHVVHLNDHMGWSFDEVADWLDLIVEGLVTPDEALSIRTRGALRRAMAAESD